MVLSALSAKELQYQEGDFFRAIFGKELKKESEWEQVAVREMDQTFSRWSDAGVYSVNAYKARQPTGPEGLPLSRPWIGYRMNEVSGEIGSMVYSYFALETKPYYVRDSRFPGEDFVDLEFVSLESGETVWIRLKNPADWRDSRDQRYRKLHPLRIYRMTDDEPKRPWKSFQRRTRPKSPGSADE